jgi:hypothetical protein
MTQRDFYELARGGAREIFATDERDLAIARAVELAQTSAIRVIVRHIHTDVDVLMSTLVWDSHEVLPLFRPTVRERLSSLAERQLAAPAG